MANPNYQGPGQPSAQSGGWLGSWLGATPAYHGEGQPSSRGKAYGSAAPAYKPARPTAARDTTDGNDGVCDAPSFAIVIPRQVIEQS